MTGRSAAAAAPTSGVDSASGCVPAQWQNFPVAPVLPDQLPLLLPRRPAWARTSGRTGNEATGASPPTLPRAFPPFSHTHPFRPRHAKPTGPPINAHCPFPSPFLLGSAPCAAASATAPTPPATDWGETNTTQLGSCIMRRTDAASNRCGAASAPFALSTLDSQCKGTRQKLLGAALLKSETLPRG